MCFRRLVIRSDVQTEDLNLVDMPIHNADALDDEAGNRLGAAGSMLEHPVFVYWCRSCGLEASHDDGICARCGGAVDCHQRVLELPDPPDAAETDGGGGLLCLRSLRAALADISVGEDVADSAVLLHEQGADREVARAVPDFANRLAAWAVPPPVQRALFNRGFTSWDQLAATLSSTPDADSLTKQLGLSTPAAEVLLRRLWHAAAESHLEAGRLAEHAHVSPREKRRMQQRAARGREPSPQPCRVSLNLEEDDEGSEDPMCLEGDEECGGPWDGRMPFMDDDDMDSLGSASGRVKQLRTRAMDV